MADIADDADDRQPRAGTAEQLNPDPCTERIVRAPIASGHRLVDDGHHWTHWRIAFIEDASGNDRNREQLEIVRRSDPAIDGHRAWLVLGLPAFDLNVHRVVRGAAKRQPVDECGTLHAWQGTHGREQAFEELQTRRTVRVPRGRQPDRRRHDALCSEPWIHGGQVQEASHEQAGANQQHERQGDLGSDERLPDPAATLTHARTMPQRV